jgi:hypothetical protein
MRIFGILALMFYFSCPVALIYKKFILSIILLALCILFTFIGYQVVH